MKSLTCNFTGRQLLDSNVEHLEVDPLTFSNVFIPLTNINYAPILKKLAIKFMVVGLSSRVIELSKATEADSNQASLMRKYSVTVTLHIPDLENIKDPDVSENGEEVNHEELIKLRKEMQAKLGEPNEATFFATVLNVSSGFCTVNFKITAKFE